MTSSARWWGSLRRGGTGTGWTTDPDYGLTGIVLSTRTMTSPEPPAHMVEFWDAAYGALAP